MQRVPRTVFLNLTCKLFEQKEKVIKGMKTTRHGHGLKRKEQRAAALHGYPHVRALRPRLRMVLQAILPEHHRRRHVRIERLGMTHQP